MNLHKVPNITLLRIKFKAFVIAQGSHTASPIPLWLELSPLLFLTLLQQFLPLIILEHYDHIPLPGMISIKLGLDPSIYIDL